MMRRLLFALLLLALTGCGTPEVPQVVALEVEPAKMEAGDDYPSSVVVKVTLENPSAAVKILRGRVRISYAGRRVAMLTLDEKVKIPARTSAVVELPLRLNIQRTAQTMQMQAALRQQRLEDIEVDYQVALRSRMVYVEQEQEAMPIEKLAGARVEQLREMLRDIFEE